MIILSSNPKKDGLIVGRDGDNKMTSRKKKVFESDLFNYLFYGNTTREKKYRIKKENQFTTTF